MRETIANNILPPLLPEGLEAGLEFSLQVLPQKQIMFLPPEKIRTLDDGKQEAFLAERWVTPPSGIDLHPMDRPLPPEKCDVAIVVGAIVEDVNQASIITHDGKRRVQISAKPMATLFRLPLVAWQCEHIGALRSG